MITWSHDESAIDMTQRLLNPDVMLGVCIVTISNYVVITFPSAAIKSILILELNLHIDDANEIRNTNIIDRTSLLFEYW